MDRPQHEDTIAQQAITHTPSACLTAVSTLSASDPVSASLPAFTLTYLAEGNANVIYTLHPNTQTHPIDAATNTTSPSPLTLHPNCTVLRLRKDLPFTQPAIEVLSAFRRKIQPLFADGFADVLVEQSLFRMGRETVEGVDSMLRGMEVEVDGGTGGGGGSRDGAGSAVRPVHRRGVYHPGFERESYGILMPNLLSLGASPPSPLPSSSDPQAGNDAKGRNKSKVETKTRLLEFKAKWLLQSPSAPDDAVRCRTCAVNSLRRLKNRGKQTQTQTETLENSNPNQNHKQKPKQKLGRGDGGFCPFALLANDQSTGTATLHSALTSMSLLYPSKTSHAQTKLQKEFVQKVQPVLRHLTGLQGKFNCVGLQDFRGGSVDRSVEAGLDSAVAVDAGSAEAAGSIGFKEGEFGVLSDEPDFAVAMALRDCSVFLVVAEDDDDDDHGNTDGDAYGDEGRHGHDDETKAASQIKAVKLADLDLKIAGGGKLERWAGTEEELIRSGMYTMSSGELEGLMGEGDVCVWREFEGR